MTAVLKVLKIVGKVILWVLAAIFIMIVAALVCPVSYDINGKKYDKTEFLAKVKLFFGLITLNLSYDENEFETIIKILGKTIGLSEKENVSETKEDKSETEELNKKSAKEHSKAVVIKQSKEFSEKNEEYKVAEKQKKPNTVISEPTKKIDENEVRKIKLEDIKEPKCSLESAEVKVKRIKMSEDFAEEEEEISEKHEKPDFNYFKKMPKEERKELINAVFKLIKSILRSVKPKDFYAKGTIGLSNPAMTGQIVGALWALNGILNKKIEAEASFEKEIINGEIGIRGRIVPAMMLLYILRFITVKPVREIIILLVKGD